MKRLTILIVSLMFLSGCIQQYLPSYGKHADKLCEENGGLNLLKIGSLNFDVLCKNGALFKDRNKVTIWNEYKNKKTLEDCLFDPKSDPNDSDRYNCKD